MNKTVHCNTNWLRFFFGLLVCFTLPAFAAPVHSTRNKGIALCDTILVNTFPGNKKDHIRLYSDAHKQMLLISANSRQKKNYQFFMFDMDGKLITQANIVNRETTVFGHLVKGNYLFEIFSNDERIKNGQLTVR